MKARIKNISKVMLNKSMNIFSRSQAGHYLLSYIVKTSIDKVVEINHNAINLKFAAPNDMCLSRALTFSTKEPETLKWIDSFPNGSTFWDIGANVGIYSVYAAKHRKCQVYAFEPSVFNLELLARNAFLNALTDQICIVPLALSDTLGTSKLRMTMTEWGGSQSTFGYKFGWDGKVLKEVFEFQTLGITMEDAIERLRIPAPDYIKMDVDGIEHLILKGGMSILESIKGILIEVNDGFEEQSEQCYAILSQAGLILKEKRHGDWLNEATNGFDRVFNQIWVRS